MAPGESVNTAGGIVTPVPADTPLKYYYSIHSEQVYASESGGVEIVWRSELANEQGEFTISRNSYIISPVPARQTRRVFWTEVPYNAPVVSLPAGIEAVHIAYREAFPATVPNPDAPPPDPENPTPTPELNTFWLDQQAGSKAFRARKRVNGVA